MVSALQNRNTPKALKRSRLGADMAIETCVSLHRYSPVVCIAIAMAMARASATA